MIWKALCLLLLLLFPFFGKAEAMKDSDMDARSRAMYQKVRCVVCSGQTIADSNSPLADSMRQYIRSKLEAGMNEAAIEEELRQHYGNDVMMEAKFSGDTLWLWLLPALMLLAGIGVTWGFFHSSRKGRLS